jgi:hypothetical protein
MIPQQALSGARPEGFCNCIKTPNWDVSELPSREFMTWAMVLQFPYKLSGPGSIFAEKPISAPSPWYCPGCGTARGTVPKHSAVAHLQA